MKYIELDLIDSVIGKARHSIKVSRIVAVVDYQDHQEYEEVLCFIVLEGLVRPIPVTSHSYTELKDLVNNC